MRPEDMRPEDMLLPTPSGICCKAGGFYIDPTRPVRLACHIKKGLTQRGFARTSVTDDCHVSYGF